MGIWKILERGTKMAMQASCGTVQSTSGLHGYEGVVSAEPMTPQLAVEPEGMSLAKKAAIGAGVFMAGVGVVQTGLMLKRRSNARALANAGKTPVPTATVPAVAEVAAVDTDKSGSSC